MKYQPKKKAAEDVVLEQNEYQKAKADLAQQDKKKGSKQAQTFAEKTTQKGNKKEKSKPTEALASPQPDQEDQSRNEENMIPEKGMKVKRVLKPKKTFKTNDGDGDWEVVEEKRETFAVKRPVYTDSEDDGDDDSSSDY